jgi:tetratricopeptide (TPR) repeat protein
LGIVLELLGKIEPAFELLERALELLPEGESEARLAAQFVLGLTHGDVGEPSLAIDCFEAAATEGGRPERVQAALAYAAAYREHYGDA